MDLAGMIAEGGEKVLIPESKSGSSGDVLKCVYNTNIED